MISEQEILNASILIVYDQNVGIKNIGYINHSWVILLLS